MLWGCLPQAAELLNDIFVNGALLVPQDGAVPAYLNPIDILPPNFLSLTVHICFLRWVAFSVASFVSLVRMALFTNNITIIVVRITHDCLITKQ